MMCELSIQVKAPRILQYLNQTQLYRHHIHLSVFQKITGVQDLSFQHSPYKNN